MWARATGERAQAQTLSRLQLQAAAIRRHIRSPLIRFTPRRYTTLAKRGETRV